MMFGAGLAPNPFILRNARVRAFVPLLAALENQNLLALLCETAAGDGSAETAANDNDIEIHRLNLRSRKRDRSKEKFIVALARKDPLGPAAQGARVCLASAGSGQSVLPLR